MGVSGLGVGVGGLGLVLFRVFRAVRAPVRRVTQGWWLTAELAVECAAGEGGGDEQSVAGAVSFPAAGVEVVEGEELHPCGQLGGEGDDGAPDLVLGE